MTSKDSPNATFSAESPDGLMPLNWQDGLETDPYGVPACLVSRFPKLAKGWPSETKDTFGPLFDGLSPSARHQCCLANKLRAVLDVNGSAEYSMTWKQWDMFARAPICRLAASGRRTSGSGCSGWPTPNATDHKGVSQPDGRRPACDDDLPSRAARLSGWPTPNAMPETRGGLQSNPKAALMRRKQGHMLNLDDAATLAGWATPASRDYKSESSHQDCNTLYGTKGRPLSRQVLGENPTSFSAETGKPAGYQLNPHFSRWLMGYPAAWLSCVDWETLSCRRSRRNS